MRRIIDQSLGNQVNPLGLKAIDDICEVDGMPLRESRLVVRQASDSGPNIFIGCTENSAVEDQPHKSFCNQNEKEKKKDNLPENSEDFVDFRVTWEERLTSGHFRNDTANGPHVNSGRVMP